MALSCPHFAIHETYPLIATICYNYKPLYFSLCSILQEYLFQQSTNPPLNIIINYLNQCLIKYNSTTLVKLFRPLYFAYNTHLKKLPYVPKNVLLKSENEMISNEVKQIQGHKQYYIFFGIINLIVKRHYMFFEKAMLLFPAIKLFI